MRYTPGKGLVVEETAEAETTDSATDSSSHTGEIGEVYNHYRLTEAGITDDNSGWWFFMRKYEDKENPYWYKKMRKEPTKDNPEGEIVEEYVGLKLEFSVPRAWTNKLRRKALAK